MLLSSAQQRRFWREWSSICRYQKWTTRAGCTETEIDKHRRDLLAAAGFTSLTQVDRAAGFDRLLAELGRLRDNIARTIEVQNPEPGIRRRYLHILRKEASTLGGEPYILSVARDRFKITTGLTTIENLTTEQLRQLMITIHARLHTKQTADASLAAEDSFPDDIEFLPDPGYEQEDLRDAHRGTEVLAQFATTENPF